MKHSSIAIIIPAYNEEKTIRQVVQGVLQHSDSVIVIDDGSSDTTAQQIADLPITLLKNPYNFGKGATLLRGFEYAELHHFEAVITIDADTQHDPADIPKFLADYQLHPHSLIIGARLYNHENAPRSRYRANKIADFFISLAAGCKIADTQSGYRLYPAELFKKYPKKMNANKKFSLESELLIDAVRWGFKPMAVPIKSYYPKNSRSSHYKPLKDTLSIVALLVKKIFF